MLRWDKIKLSREEQYDLVQRSLAGDDGAFTTLHGYTKRYVVSAIGSICSRDDLEDYVQDAFVQIYRKLSSFAGDSAFTTWASTISRNVALEKLRRRKGREDREAFSLDNGFTNDDGETVKIEVPFLPPEYEFVGDVAKLRDCIASLPDGYRRVAELRMQGLEHHEIAEACGFTKGCSKSQWHKAQQKLKELLLRPLRYCRECGKTIKHRRTYCTPTCALTYAAHKRRKVDPERLEVLHKVNWLSRNQLAQIFGVTRHGINNVITRYGLSRFLPKTCKINGCDQPVIHRHHCKGHLYGNLCETHRKAKQVEYVRASRRRRHPPSTPEQRRENARRASLARWSAVKRSVATLD